MRLTKHWQNARRLKTFPLIALFMCSLFATVLASGIALGGGIPSAQASPVVGGLHISGNQLLDSNGQQVIPRGVNRSGSEYACIQGFGDFDGPSDAASVQAMASWGIKSVRVPLNEDCWLNINMGSSPYGGAQYQTAIENYVNLLHANGMYAEITDMWGAPGSQQATSNPAITNADHSPTFWTSVANAFKNDSAVFLGLMNEPHGVTANCWLNGGSACSGQVSYTAAGSQSLVNAIRGTGATNPIAVQCIDYSNNCTGWLANKPVDPANALMAEAHIYGGNACQTVSCLNSQVAPVAAQVPLILGETGETFDGSDCNNSSTNISAYMNWADAHNVGYQAWTWDTWGSCNLSLITNYNGTPFGVYGNFVKTHLLAEAGQNPPPPAAPSISGFSPAHAQVGASVTISGAGFTGATSVKFNGTAATFSVPSDSSITTSVPTGATSGTLSVTTPNGSATSSASFTVDTTPPPPPPPSGKVAMGFAIGWSMPANPPWGDINQENLFGLQTTNGSALDTHFLTDNGVNVPAFVAAAHAHGVKALITIGGIDDQNWENACVGANQAPFVSNLVNYMQSNGFDGIDLDIEDRLWTSEGPPAADMTACIHAISTAAKAVQTQAGAVPIISGDVITDWSGPWWAPSNADIDQFNLMTYGDTISAGNYAADVQKTVSQGVTKSKMVGGIDVIDAPSTNNQCGPFEQYATDNGLAGAFVWDEQTDGANGYPCFNQFAPFLGGGSPPPAPVASISPATLPFGNQVQGTSSSAHGVTLTNSGNADMHISGIAVSGSNAADFAETNNCPATLAAGANCTANVTFTPSTQSAESASLTFTDDAAGSPQAVPLSGTGTAPAGCTQAISAVSASATPSSVNPGDTLHLGMQLTANCADTLTVAWDIYDSTHTLVAQIAQTSDAASVGVNSYSGSWVVPAGQASGSYSVSVGVWEANWGPVLFFQDNEASFTVGTPPPPPAPVVSLSPSSLSFGNQNVGTTSAAKSVTLTNTGNAALSITSIGEAGANAADFAESNNCPASLAAQASCLINVTFSPSAAGAESANIALVDNAANSPQSVAESGTGVTPPPPAPVVSLSPSSLAFGNVQQGSPSAAKSVTLTNTGNAALSISGISEAGANAADFAQSNNCPASLAAQASCTINVVFTPSIVGAESANISLVDNAADSPQSVSESGTGTAVSSGLTLVQAKSKFFASGGTIATPFTSNVAANHLLVAVIDYAGGNAYHVGAVTDSLGNTWTKAVAGVNGDNSDVEVWYTNSVAAGADTVSATHVGSGFLQAYVTISEYSGKGVLDGSHAAASSGTSHSSGALVSKANDLVVGGYTDAGYNTTLVVGGSKTLLGAKQASTVNQQAIQEYGTATGTSDSAVFTSGASAAGEVAAASFTPAP